MNCPHDPKHHRLVNVRPAWIWRCEICREIVASVEEPAR